MALLQLYICQYLSIFVKVYVFESQPQKPDIFNLGELPKPNSPNFLNGLAWEKW